MPETARNVGPEPAAAPAPREGAPEPGSERPRARRRLPVVLLVLLVAACVWIAWQLRANRALEARVGELSRELSATREELSAYQGHLGEVRDRVADLRAQLSELDEVVRRDPTAPTAPSVPSVPSE